MSNVKAESEFLQNLIGMLNAKLTITRGWAETLSEQLGVATAEAVDLERKLEAAELKARRLRPLPVVCLKVLQQAAAPGGCTYARLNSKDQPSRTDDAALLRDLGFITLERIGAQYTRPHAVATAEGRAKLTQESVGETLQVPRQRAMTGA